MFFHSRMFRNCWKSFLKIMYIDGSETWFRQTLSVNLNVSRSRCSSHQSSWWGVFFWRSNIIVKCRWVVLKAQRLETNRPGDALLAGFTWLWVIMAVNFGQLYSSSLPWKGPSWALNATVSSRTHFTSIANGYCESTDAEKGDPSGQHAFRLYIVLDRSILPHIVQNVEFWKRVLSAEDDKHTHE